MSPSPGGVSVVERQRILELVERSGLIAVIRGMDPAVMRDIARALVAGGVRALEITMNSPQPLQMISQVRSLLEGSDTIIGAGTVLDSETARAAMLAGAQFIVAPNLNLEVIQTCRRYSCPVVPGAMTPTEMIRAWEAGADMVKVFPAGALGPGFVKDVKGPLPHIKIVPTGGIDLENAASYIRAGAAALGVGGGLVDSRTVAARDYGRLTERALAYRRVIDEARGV